MAELSSLLFVDTDELGRPTGLIASEETDTFASALMPQDVKDTVEIVKVADVSTNYPGWNTVSGVSALADVSGELLALPGDFEDLEASVGYVSSVVDTIDPAAINSVSATVLNSSGNWESTYSYIESASGNISSASSLVIGADSGLSSLETSVGEISTVVETIDPDAINGVSGTVYNNSGTWNDASGVSAIDDVSGTVYNNSGTWNDASSVSGFDGVSSVVYDNSSTWNDASGVSAIDDVSGTVYNNSGTWNDASSVSGFDDVSSTVYNNSGTWNDASSVSGFDDVSSTVYNNSGTWNDASGVSAIDDVSGTVYNNSGTWNDASSVSGFDDVSSTVYNNSGTWNDASGVSAIDDVSGTVYNNSGTWNDASGVSAIDDVSGTVYNNSGTWNDASSVSGFNDISAIVSDGSGVLSSLSGSIPGNENGPDVPIFSALSAIADRIRVVDTITGEDAASGQTIYLSGASRITTRANTAVADLTFGPGNQEIAVLKLQNSLGGVAYLSGTGGAGLMSPAGGDIWMAEEALGGATQTSSLRGLYQKTSDSSGNWDATYTYVDSASGNIDNVSGHVSDTSSDIVSVSSYVSDTSSDVVDVSNYVSDTSSDVVSVSSYVSDTSSDVVTVSGLVIDGSTILSALSGNNESFNSSRSKALGLSALEQRLTIGNAAGTENLEGGTFLLLSGAAGIATKASTATFIANDATKGIQVGSSNLNIVHPSIKYGPTGSLSSLIPIIDDLASVSGTGGGGGGGLSSIASAILVSDGSAVDIDIGGTPENNTILVLDTENELFTYERVAFQVIGDTISPVTESLGFDFGGGTARNFVTSGSTKTLLEFDGKSRVALGRNSVPLEISALSGADIDIGKDSTVNFDGSSEITLAADADKEGPLLLLQAGDGPNYAAGPRLYLQNAALSADSGSQIDIDTDINMGGSTHLVGNTIGANHIACKNETGATITAGTPVYITSFVGASNKISIAEASASVASSMPAIGVASTDLTATQEGYVDAFGVADGIDTQTPGFALQDTLYVAPSGGLTNVRPTATADLVQNIGIVERVDNSNGKIIVLGPGRTNDVPTSVNNDVTFASPITINNTLTANGGTGSTHPTAGGQVLQSRGSSSVTWGNKKKFRWYESDFHSADVRINGPWLGAAVNAGTTGAGVSPVSLWSEMVGAVLLRSSTTANSGYRWDTQATDRIPPRVNLFFECIFAIPDDFNNKTVKLGFYDDTTDTTAGIDGTYFLIDNSGNMTPETSNNSTRTTGTSYTLSVDTVYKAQIWWNTSTSVVFKITNMDESTTHASETISTNLPSSTARRFGAGLVTKSSGTAIDNLLVLDYMGWGLYPYREDDSV